MKRTLLVFTFLMICLAGFAQAEPQQPQEPQQPEYWTRNLNTQIGFSQVSLSNWAAGGFGSMSLNGYIDGNLIYEKDRFKWTNRLQMGYGFIQTYGEGFKKTDDRFILDMKAGYKAFDKFYISAIYNFQTQFGPGYKTVRGTDIISNAFAPAYTSLGIGIDYTPSKNVSINLSPLVAKVVMVKDPALRKKYGNEEDQFARVELGAQLKFDGKVEIEDFSAGTTLTLFSDYLDHPLNIKVNWDVNISAKLTKFLAATIRTSLIYDDKIKHIEWKDKNGNVVLDKDGNPIMVPGVQFKELSSISFSYTFGKK
ncbi:MAG: DUF3078 domain-containing protein [Bacteroidales bacterium]|nr:DUF3078 domain-containing protein [Bacteroidales bacterium]